MRGGWLAALLPLLLLLAMVGIFIGTDGAGLKEKPAAPIETVEFERVVLKDKEIWAYVRNSSPEAVKVATVFVNDAVVAAHAYPSDEIPRLGRARIQIDYHWVQGEPVTVSLLTANSVIFEHVVAAATLTPEPGWPTFIKYLLIGLYVGVIPVGLGVLWYPVLRRLGRRGIQLILALTVGLLAFLAVDTITEAFELAGKVPGVFQGKMLVISFTLLSLLLLVAVGQRMNKGSAGGAPALRRLRLSYLIALGIGLHNLGEGLAIGASYAAGQASLGAFLIIGFTLHNVTEGVGIVSPLTQHKPEVKHFIRLAALAGLPAILGTWIGGFVINPVVSTIFFAMGAGAILQVIYEVGKLIWEQSASDQKPALSMSNVGAFTAGLTLMWLTALLVK
jgi:ZIP family zinc transporter